MAFLSARRRRPEIMDQPDLNPAEHHRALGGLARINLLSGSARILWPPLLALGRALGKRDLRILDLATGGGDVPIRLWRKAAQAGLDWHIEGWDFSPVAVEHAQKRAAQARAGVSFAVQDVLQGPPFAGYDAVVCSLFLHHLDEDQARGLLRRMAGFGAAQQDSRPRLVLVNDLVRSLAGLALAHLGSRLLTFSHVVHVDGPRSVEGAFTLAEARALAKEAGLHGATIERRWPCRFLLSWRRP
jgi:SAM-dependent methyltransferase